MTSETQDALMRALVKKLCWDDGGSAEAPLRAAGFVIDGLRHDYARLVSPGRPDRVFRGDNARAAAQAAAEAAFRAKIAAALNLDAVAELVEAGQTLEAALQGDSLGDVDGARDAFDATLSAFTSTSQSRPGKANINNAVMQAAQTARDVFEGHKRAKEAIDYMEQLLLARFRGQP